MPDHKLDGFKLKIEKETNVASFGFLGIHIKQQMNISGIDKIKMTQLGLIKKFLEIIGMIGCRPKPVPANIKPLPTDSNGINHYKSWE